MTISSVTFEQTSYLLHPCHCLLAGFKHNTVYTLSKLAIPETGLTHLHLQWPPRVQAFRRQQRLSSVIFLAPFSSCSPSSSPQAIPQAIPKPSHLVPSAPLSASSETSLAHTLLIFLWHIVIQHLSHQPELPIMLSGPHTCTHTSRWAIYMRSNTISVTITTCKLQRRVRLLPSRIQFLAGFASQHFSPSW